MAASLLRIRIPVLLAALSLMLLGVVTLAAPSARAAGGFTAHGSARQVYVVGLPAGASATLLDDQGQPVSTKRADSLGGLLFRHVQPGTGYQVRDDATGATSGPLTVHSEAAAPWDPSIYDQSIPDDGYSYLTTRDGTKLAISVHPPTHPAGIGGLPEGFPVPNGPDYAPPYPTLIEYSGYAYADPSGPVNGIAAIANLMGFAVVDVSMRGTGCSGGAFDFFEPLQNLDGYDVVETIAHQPWVKDHKVGMMGISYGGISQLFT
ncbi:MAG: CocE/NonD family hydrolase, partial [Nocardioidaceae bacterium]